ncbi:DUF3397 family protein [Weissella confusa]|uniref:DUF3397 family protein n=1 Tax=Weissella confusa TaxID=1583 RepID=UPI0005DBC706|nr:DUF3397 family protein [Weissella confusa]MEE0002445.1 DUF3397 family protein [Weissella confusa]COJ36915.1 Protein of uncharacterised function (DUF3397) [Streptococcus pneumoniae]
MLTTLDWQLTVALAFATWIGLILFHRLFRRLTWPKWMRPIDLATLVAWWAIEVISFQVWHLSLLPPILFMFVLWGIGLALYQGFVRQTFTTKTFWMMWWRIVGLGSFVALIGLSIFAFILTK